MKRFYHNPRCSKSRQALALLEEAKIDFELIDYQKDDLSYDHWINLFSLWTGDLQELVRLNDEFFSMLDPENIKWTVSQVAQLIYEQPQLLQRPLLTDGKTIVVGRPPETIQVLF